MSTFSFQLRSQDEAGGEELQEAGEDNERLPSWPQHARPRYRSPHNPYSRHRGHGEDNQTRLQLSLSCCQVKLDEEAPDLLPPSRIF